MEPTFLQRAKKAVFGALVAGAGALAAGWLSGHHLNWVEALDAVVATLIAGFGIYKIRNQYSSADRQSGKP